MNRVPDFFMVGAPKAGTTSLYHYLVQHPDIFMSDPKEPHFFYNRESPGAPVLSTNRGALSCKAASKNLASNPVNLEEYLGLFEGVPEDKLVGEASTSYLWLANAASEIKQLQPEAKIIILLRDPVKRAYSHYWYQVRDGKKFKKFEKALEEEPERIRQGKWHGLYHIDNGMYADQVERYLETFGAGSVRVYLFEDLMRDALGVCRDVFGFLGVDPSAPVEVERVFNRGGAPKSLLFARFLREPRIKRPLKKVLPLALRTNLIELLKETNNKPVPEMEPETEARLRETFHDDLLRLEKMIGRDLSHWREREPAF